MTISRRSFLRGLAALPLVAALPPKEVPAIPATKYKHKEYSSSFTVHGDCIVEAIADEPIHPGMIVYYHNGRVRPYKDNELWGDDKQRGGVWLGNNKVLVQGTA